jgi:hypothetical protein
VKKEELKEKDRKHAERSESRHRAKTYKDRAVRDKDSRKQPPSVPDDHKTCEGCDSEVEEDQFCICCNYCFECCEHTDHECSGEDDGCPCPCCNKPEEGED